ncbi:MAG: replicative DNA helicase, partial [Sphingomonadales bacterium]
MKHEKITTATFSVEAEQQLLGAILANNDRYHEVSGFLKADHFYEPTHAAIWRVMAGRIEKDHVASPVSLGVDMGDHDGLKQLGGHPYLGRLVGASISGFAVKDYAKLIVETHGRRSMAGRLEQIREDVLAGRDADDAASELELMLFEREDASDKPRTMSMLKAQTAALTQMNEIY